VTTVSFFRRFRSALAKMVVEKGADAGLAFDGDGDRVIAVDELGNIVVRSEKFPLCKNQFLNRQISD
jgi:phosphoglucosamine mutase